MKSVVLETDLEAHGVKPEHAIICGSTPIAAAFEDFRQPGDVDVVVPLVAFLKLMFTHGWRLVWPHRGASWRETHVACEGYEAFFCWKLGRTFVPYHTLARQSVAVNHLHFANLAWVKRYKRLLQRDKDLRDLAFLRLHHAK